MDDSRRIELLLVEDDPVDATLVGQLLERADVCPYGLRTVGTVADAESVLVNERVDCVLLDLSLPDSDGIESVRRVHRIAPTVPIIVLTGRDDRDYGLEAIEAGAQDFLVKGQPKGNSILRCARWAVARMRASSVRPVADLRWMVSGEGPGAGELESVLDLITAGAALLGADLAFRTANDAFADLVGYTEPELVGAPFTDLLIVDDLIATMLEIRAVLKDEQGAHQLRVGLHHRGGGESAATVVLSRVAPLGLGEPGLLVLVSDVEEALVGI